LNILFAVVLSLVLEALALKLRGKSIATGISDGSIILAAWLLALAIPPLLPFWQLSVGVVVMVMLGKHIYGGLGCNPFNPAMVGYAVLLISFPQTMTWWFAEGALNQLNFTTIVQAKLRIAPEATSVNRWSTYAAWTWVNVAFLLGGLFLLYKRIIQWQIPLSLLVSFTLLQLLFADSSSPHVYYEWLSGALILGAFFIATDPVTAASSKRGRLIYGAGIGALTFIIREYGGYPEGIAFAA